MLWYYCLLGILLRLALDIPCVHATTTPLEVIPGYFVATNPAIQATEYGGGLWSDGAFSAPPRFWQPQKIQFMPSDPNYVMLVTDTQNHAIRVVDLTRKQVSTLFGTPNTYTDSQFSCLANSTQGCSSSTDNMLRMPYSLAIHPYQTWVVVADTRNRALRKINLFSKEMSTLVALDTVDNNEPLDLVWASPTTLLVLMSTNAIYSLSIQDPIAMVPFQPNGLQQLQGLDTITNGMMQQNLGMAYNAEDKVLYVGDFGGKVIYALQLDAALSTVLSYSVVVGNANNPEGVMRDNDWTLPLDTALSAFLGGPTQLHYVPAKKVLYFTDRVPAFQVEDMSISALRMWDVQRNQVKSLSTLASEDDAGEGMMWGLGASAHSDQQLLLAFSTANANSIQTLSITFGSTFPCPVGFFSTTESNACVACTNPKPPHVKYIGSENGCEWVCPALYPLQQPFACDGLQVPEARPSAQNSQWVVLDTTPATLSFVCTAGFYKKTPYTEGEENCLLCPADSYCTGLDFNRTGLQQCPQWASNHVVKSVVSFLGATSVLNCSCPAGYFWNTTTDQCTLCPIGFYCPFSAIQTRQPPQACPVNKTTWAEGSQSLEADCVCKPGFVGPNGGGGICTPCISVIQCPGGNATAGCPPNTRLPDNETTFKSPNQCKPLPGFYQLHGLGTEGVECPVGTYCPGGFVSPYTPIQCPANANTSSRASSTVWDCKCRETLYLSNTSLQCEACPKGYYCGGNGSITLCPFGLTTQSIGSSTIANCTCPLPLPQLANYTYTVNATFHHYQALPRPCYWKCPQGYRRSSLNYLTDPTASCVLCTQPNPAVPSTLCANGSYYAGCASEISDGTADATCQPCTNAPVSAVQGAVRYVSPGLQKNLVGVNDCGWMCWIGYFLRFSSIINSFSCSSCTTASCPMGQYRENCTSLNRTVNAGCFNCTPAAPLYGYLDYAFPYNVNNCTVRCLYGYWYLPSKNKCCSDNAVFSRRVNDCVCSAGFKSPSPQLNGVVCTV